jgi:hypothetical protein
MSKSNYLENAIINHVLRNVPLTSPATVYVALYTSDPGEGDTGTEVSGGSYARRPVTFGAPADGVSTNSALVLFAQATAAWGTVTHFGIRDALTLGNLLYSAALTTSNTIGINDAAKFEVGTLSVTEQ